MRATDCDRYGATVHGQRITYDALTRRYICNECGGRIAHRFTRENDRTVDSVACAACGCEEFVSERRYLEQIAEGWEVERGLPEAIRNLLQGGHKCLSATEAIADLFG